MVVVLLPVVWIPSVALWAWAQYPGWVRQRPSRARDRVDPAIHREVWTSTGAWGLIGSVLLAALAALTYRTWWACVPLFAVAAATLATALAVLRDAALPVWVRWTPVVALAALAATVLTAFPAAVLADGWSLENAAGLALFGVVAYGPIFAAPVAVAWRLLVISYAQAGARTKAREALGLIPAKELA